MWDIIKNCVEVRNSTTHLTLICPKASKPAAPYSNSALCKDRGHSQITSYFHFSLVFFGESQLVDYISSLE